MFPTLNEREKILVSTLLILCGLFVLYKYVYIKEIAHFKEVKANYILLNNKVNEYNQKAARLDELKKEEAALQAKVALVTAPFNVDIMGGQHMSFIGERLENAGLKIVDAAPVSTRVYDNYYVQDIDFNIQGTYGGLQQFFYDTENSQYAYKIVKFQITPQLLEGLDPQLVSINYNKLNSHVLISVVADKAAKVAKPVNQTMKFDIFKPSDSEILKMQKLQAMQKLKKIQELGPQPSTPEPQREDTSYVPSRIDPVPVTISPPAKVASQKKAQEVLNYSFEKK